MELPKCRETYGNRDMVVPLGWSGTHDTQGMGRGNMLRTLVERMVLDL